MDDNDAPAPEPEPLVLQTKKKDKNRYEICVDVKPRKRNGKCVGMVEKILPTMEPIAVVPFVPYTHLSNEIWFHISHHVAPEMVRTFALICSQTAAIVRSRYFWWNLYKRYCNGSPNKWNLLLPESLQYENMQNHKVDILRCHVIRALFLCYEPLVAQLRYPLDKLIGHTYVASWAIRGPCEWIMCYKFWNRLKTINRNVNTPMPTTEKHIPISEISDWELLADEHVVNTSTFKQSPDCAMEITQKSLRDTNHNEGVNLLLIISKRYMPFPSHLIYGLESDGTRLAATRQILSSNMCSSNLELDFIDGCHKTICSIKYQHISKCIVLPWWHPDFRKFIK